MRSLRFLHRVPFFWDALFIICCIIIVVYVFRLIKEIYAGKWALRSTKKKIESFLGLIYFICYGIASRLEQSNNETILILPLLFFPIVTNWIWENIIINSNNIIKLKKDGDAKYDSNDYKGAFSDYNKAIVINPENAEAYYKRGKVKFALKDYGGAISDYDKAIELDSSLLLGISVDCYPILIKRGLSKAKLRDHKGAINDFNEVIKFQEKQEQNDPSALRILRKERGNSKNELGDLKGACEDWKKASELGDEEAAELLKENCE
tara:strand:- start:9 stop:800 length:792 start_codon:yes stop_codon:yes gene_type:complete